jgi:probable phosphoglycerate mutase
MSMSMSTSTRIFLVRHGATALSAENRFAGAGADIPLSEEGRNQARHLAIRLADERIDAAYASPLERTLDTARIVATPHGIAVSANDALREIDHGHWDQLTRDEVEEKFPGEYQLWEEDPYTFAPAGGETGLAVTARALPALLAIVKSHAGQQALVVSHKATIRLIVSSLLGFDPRMYRDHLDLSPASLTILDFKGMMHARLTLYNDTAHYSARGMAIPEVPANRLSKWWDDASAKA